jgi:hypothetical protein
MTVPIFVTEQATVYRAGGRRWFTRQAAIKAYAGAKWRAKHPCECEHGDYASGYPGYTCQTHDARDAVMPRYLRVLRRALATNNGSGDEASGSASHNGLCDQGRQEENTVPAQGEEPR